MKFLHLVWSALMRKPIRTVFTLLSIVAAFLLFGLLDSVRSTFAGAGDSVTGIDRLVVVSKLSFIVQLPKSLEQQIQAVPGVESVGYANWFGGVYQDQKNFFANQAVSSNYLDLFPEFELSGKEREAFRNTRTGAVVGQALADQYHWKIGDKIPLQATIFPLKDGSNNWVFDLVGIYHLADPKQRGKEKALLFNWDYFYEARAFGGANVGWYVVKIKDRTQTDRVAQAIDALSANSDHETKTQSEQAFQLSFASQFGNIGLIVGGIMAAVFFTLMLLTGNTMTQAVRERIPELGVLKTLGFTHVGVLALVLAESITLLLLGGVIGMLLSSGVVAGIRDSLGIEIYPIGGVIWLRGIIVMVLVGLLIGAIPAVRAMRLRIVDALAGR